MACHKRHVNNGHAKLMSALFWQINGHNYVHVYVQSEF